MARGRRARGGNTDAYGFAANLDDRAPGWDDGASAAVVLGAGGAARAVIHALEAARLRRYPHRQPHARRARRSWPIASAQAFRPIGSASRSELLPDAGLLVNTTSLGMHGERRRCRSISTRLPGQRVVTDIVYVPLETPLLAAARRAG